MTTETPITPPAAASKTLRERLPSLKVTVLSLIGIFLVIQLVPYGHTYSNPPVTKEAPWPNAQVRQIAVDGCYTCHSNLTKWRYYTRVAPSSWLAANDVSGGRSNLNFSEWDHAQPTLADLQEAINSGGMPPLQYKVPHPSARLTSAQRKQLSDAVAKIYATSPPKTKTTGG